MGMTTQVNGHDVPIEIAHGLCHQVVREYAAGDVRGYKDPSGSTTRGMPWFADFRHAVTFLDNKPFAGYSQTMIMKEDGSGPSWITAGVYYRKAGGRKDGPVTCIDCDLASMDDGWLSIKPLASSVIELHGQQQLEARFETSNLHQQDGSQWPAEFRKALADAELWCCPTVLTHVAVVPTTGV